LSAGAPFSAPPFAALPGAFVVVVLAALLDEALNAVAPTAPPTSIAPATAAATARLRMVCIGRTSVLACHPVARGLTTTVTAARRSQLCAS